jgi:protease-4
MSDSTTRKSDFLAELWRELKEARQTMAESLAALGVSIRNQLRAMRGAQVDYVVMAVGGSLPERAAPRRTFIERQLPLPSPPLSMEVLNNRLQAIADADNVKGVVFVWQDFTAGLATVQNLRRAMQRLRAAGKEAIVFTPYVDLAHYYAATAADRIIIPPSSQFDVLGLHAEAIFLKDALDRLGVEAEVVQISPYKTGANLFGRSDITPEQREQIEWLLDDRFDMITADIAAGRRKSQAEIKQWIDRAPLLAEEALAAGLVDHLAYEDELAFLLAEPTTEPVAEPIADPMTEPGREETTAPPSGGQSTPPAAGLEEAGAGQDGAKQAQANLVPWPKAQGLLLEKRRRRSPKFIGVISLEGGIVMGPSRQPPIELPIPFIGGAAAGEQTLLKMLRRAQKLDDMAALIFHVDSPGGAALASDLIGREIKRINQKKPVLVYMGNMAASGGYYVSAPARHIMSQRGTLTGSIGVWSARIHTSGLYRKIDVNRVTLERGEHAGLYSDAAPLTEEERQILWRAIVHAYEQFKQIVADGRNLPYDELDAICEGKVWTGRQAYERKLVDSHGDFVDAVCQAAELAGLPTDDQHIIPVVNIQPKGGSYAPPEPFATAGALATLNQWLAGEWLRDISGQPLLLLPYKIKFW